MEPLPKPAKLSLLQHIVVFGIARALGRTLLTILGRAKVVGKRQVPRRGGLLILSNHLSDVDVLLIQISCPRNIIFMAKAELFELKWLAPLMRSGGTFPVKRGEPDRNALRHAAELLKLGQVVCLFPEGELSESGKLQRIKSGVSLIIRLAQVPVICIGLQNTNQIMPYGSLSLHKSRDQVLSTWGKQRLFLRRRAVRKSSNGLQSSLLISPIPKFEMIRICNA